MLVHMTFSRQLGLAKLFSRAAAQAHRMSPISQPSCSQPFTAKRSGNICAGEMVLLLHWSMLNYAAVVKILKKHGASPLQKLLTPLCNHFHLQSQAYMPSLMHCMDVCCHKIVFPRLMSSAHLLQIRTLGWCCGHHSWRPYSSR